MPVKNRLCVEIHMPQSVYIYDPEIPVPEDVQYVEIPKGITIIKKNAFTSHHSLRSVTIPDSVTVIGENAFAYCYNLQSVTMPDRVTKIGKFVFSGCYGLQSVTIPNGVTLIGEGTFYGCHGLQSITIPDSVTEIGRGAFYGCSGLQSVTIPDSVTKFGCSAFAHCTGLQSVTIPESVKEIEDYAFHHCSNLQSVIIKSGIKRIANGVFAMCPRLQTVTMPDSVTDINRDAFYGCTALPSLMYRNTDIAPFININGYGVNVFRIIKTLVDYGIPLNENTVKTGIDMEHQDRLPEWIREYPLFGTMRLSADIKSPAGTIKEQLRQCFAGQKRTKHHIPKILDELAIAACTCGIPPERLAETFDIEYTQNLLSEKIPIVPATACRCYYDRNTCDMLIRKDTITIMAEAINLYNRSGHRECYKYLMDFILSHPDTKSEDLRYATDRAEEIPMRTGTTLAQVRQHKTYTENLAEVEKIEAEYGKTVPGFKLTDYPCGIAPTGITYDGMTARVLDLSDKKDIALAARLGELTNCCQSLGKAGETAMMHGFLNPDAGFWVIEDKDGKVKAQAVIWKADNGDLVFDNIEFADTDSGHRAERVNQLRGVIAAWATESGYQNIIMGCGYNELGTESMEQAPIPKLRLTPEEVFALQEDNGALVLFTNIEAARRYTQTAEYNPRHFVYTDTDERCVYIKKDGKVSEYLMEGYDRALVNTHLPDGNKTVEPPDNRVTCRQ